MTVDTADTATAPDPAQELAPDRPVGRHSDPATRGVTRIADRVVEKVAGQAVAEVDRATGAPRRVLGVSLGTPDLDTSALVSARVDGASATVQVVMTVLYPASVRAVTRDTRRHLIDRVAQLTGVQVRQVDIDVTGMTAEGPDRARVR